MNPIFIKMEGATLLHDALVAPSDDGREVFVHPANIGALQIDEHPGKRMVVVTLPRVDFDFISLELIEKGGATLTTSRAPGKPRSGVEAHALNLEIERAVGKEA